MAGSVARDVPPGAVRRELVRVTDGGARAQGDWIAEEVPVAIAFNGDPFAVMMATPADLEDFVLGFALSEGLVDAPDQLAVERIDTFLDGIQVSATVPDAHHQRIAARRRTIEGRSGCGICGAESIEAVLRAPARVVQGPALTAAALSRAAASMQAHQSLNALTGATHAAGWADAHGRLQLVREDIGRHNALDKLIGAMARAHVPVDQGFCVVSSRASYEMAMKAATLRMPLLLAISAATALAIALAETAGMTLAGFARDGSFAIYTHPSRVLTGSVAASPP